MRKTLEALFYHLWTLFHAHRWKYPDYVAARDRYDAGPHRVCQEPQCQKIEYFTEYE